MRRIPYLSGCVRKRLPSPVYRLYRRWRTRRLVDRYEPRTVEHFYGSRRFQVRLEDGLAEAWYDKDWEEPPEIGFLRDHGLAPGTTVFDLGAHHGVMALMLADVVGPAGKVIAIEAGKHNARVAAINSRLNQLPQITVQHAAAAAKPGTLFVADDLNTRITPGRIGKAEVEAVTVDQLAATHGQPAAILIDIEGFELQALRGGWQALKARPALVIEVHTGLGLEEAGGSVDDILHVLAGYKIWTLTEGGYARSEAFRPLEAVPTTRFFIGAA